VDAILQNGDTPLHMAAENGHVACIMLLVECNANKEAENYRRYTAPPPAAAVCAAAVRSCRAAADVRILI
jgi:ankyrin repeat protein